MSAPSSLLDYASPVTNDVQYVPGSHARFIQIQSILSGTHPHVQEGQVWEDISPHANRTHVLIKQVNDDGTVYAETVYLGQGSHEGVGIELTLPTYGFRVEGHDRGYRLRAALTLLDSNGSPLNSYEAPQPIILSNLVTPDPVPRRTSTKKVPSSKDVAPVITSVDGSTQVEEGNKSGSGVTFISPTAENNASPHKRSRLSFDKPAHPSHLSRIASELAGSDGSVKDEHTALAHSILKEMSVGPAIVFARSLVKDKGLRIPSYTNKEDLDLLLSQVSQQASEWIKKASIRA